MYVRTCVLMCTYVCTHVRTNVRTYVCIRTYLRMYLRTQLRTYVCVRTYVCMYARTRVRTCARSLFNIRTHDIEPLWRDWARYLIIYSKKEAHANMQIILLHKGLKHMNTASEFGFALFDGLKQTQKLLSNEVRNQTMGMSRNTEFQGAHNMLLDTAM